MTESDKNLLLHPMSNTISPADVERPPGVSGEGCDLPGDELDGVAVEDPQPGQPRGHDLPEWKFIINRLIYVYYN